MFQTYKFNPFMKSTAVVTLICFLWSQVVWAADISIIPTQTTPEVNGYLTPENLQSAQSAVDNLMAVQQDAVVLCGATGEEDGATYEYDEQGRVVTTHYPDGDFKTTTYWPGTSYKQYDCYYHDGWVWYKSEEYYNAPGTVIHYAWIADEDPGHEGDSVFEEYNSSGNIIKRVFDNANFELVEYWAGTTNKKYEQYYTQNWAWIESWEFYNTADGIPHYRWIADTDTGTAGDCVFEEYDSLGRMTKQTFDNGDFSMIDYWTGSYNPQYKAYYHSDWTWFETYGYFNAADNILQYHWVSDKNPGVDGDVNFEEYNINGQLTRQNFDNGRFALLEYWQDTGYLSSKTYYYLDWTWIGAYVCYNTQDEHKQYEWLTDPNSGVAGDVIYAEYNMDGNRTLERYDNSEFAEMLYWTGADELFRKNYFRNDWEWMGGEEFYEDGVTRHFRFWAEGETLNGLTYESYDLTGAVEVQRFSNGVDLVYDGLGHLLRRVDKPTNTYEEYYYDGTAAVTRLDVYESGGVYKVYSGIGGELLFEYVPSSNTYNNYESELVIPEGNTITVTNENGDRLNYIGEQLISIDFQNGAQLTSIQLDGEGALENAIMRETNGNAYLIYEGEVVLSLEQGGVITGYRNEQRAVEGDAEGWKTLFSFMKDSSGETRFIQTLTEDVECVYSADGKPVRFYKPNNEVSFFSDGKLDRITFYGNSDYSYVSVTSDLPDGVVCAKVLSSVTIQGQMPQEYTAQIELPMVVPVRIEYDENNNYKKVIMSDGSIYENTNDNFTFKNINGDMVMEKGELTTVLSGDGVTRVYDNSTGNLLSLAIDGVDITLDDNGAFSIQMVDGSFLDVSSFGEEQGDGVFNKYDDNGNLLSKSVYQNGHLILYTDQYGNEYEYNEEGTLTKLKKICSDSTYITYNYYAAELVTMQLQNDQLPLVSDDTPVLLKYERTRDGDKLVYLKTKDSRFKQAFYNNTGITVYEGSIEVIDGVETLNVECTKTYDVNCRLVKSELISGITIEYMYTAEGQLNDISVRKDGAVYRFVDDKLVEVLTAEGVKTTYANNGLIKSIEIIPGEITTYSYGFINNTYNLNNLTLNPFCNNISVVNNPDQTVTLSLQKYADPYITTMRHFDSYTTPISYYGNAHISYDDPAVGIGSMALDGSNDYAWMDYNQNWNFGDGDMTLEMFVKFDDLQNDHWYALLSQQRISDHANSHGWLLYFYYNQLPGVPRSSQLGYGICANYVSLWGISIEWVPVEDEWYHIAYTRENNVHRLFIDGQLVAQGYSTAYLPSGLEDPIVFGGLLADGGVAKFCLNGSLDEVRVSKGIARYTQDFIVPDESYGQYLYSSEQGSFMSQAYFIGNDELKTISWDFTSSMPAGCSYNLSYRVGQSSDLEDGTWSNWFTTPNSSNGKQIVQSSDSYLQYKIELNTENLSFAPEITIDLTKGINISTYNFEENAADVEDVSQMEFLKSSVANYYDINGINLFNTADKIDAPQILMDDVFSNNIIVFDDSIEGFNSQSLVFGGNVSDISSYTETVRDVVIGAVDMADVNRLGLKDATRVIYENITDGSGNPGRRILSTENLNHETSYYNYGDTNYVLSLVNDEAGNPYCYKITYYGVNDQKTEEKVIYLDSGRIQRILYENNRISKVLENDQEIMTYSYITNSAGTQETVITDYSKGVTNSVDKYYEGEKLTKTIDKEGVTTEYLYAENGRIQRCVLSKAGKELDVFDYTYDEEKEQMIAINLQGVKKVYNYDNKLLYVEKDNKIYAYYYVNDSETVLNGDTEIIKDYVDRIAQLSDPNELLRDTDLNTETGDPGDRFVYTQSDNFAIEQLIMYTDEQGNVVHYDEGEIDYIELADGTLICDVKMVDGVCESFSVKTTQNNESVTVKIEKGIVISETYDDGRSITYYENGWKRSEKTADGIETQYFYETPFNLAGISSGTVDYTQKEEVDGVNNRLSVSGDAPEGIGTFISDVYCVNASELCSLDWDSYMPQGSQLTISIRTTGNYDKNAPEQTEWSAWSEALTQPGSLYGVPSGKYIQFKIFMKTNSNGDTPTIDLESVNILMRSRIDEENSILLKNSFTQNDKEYFYNGNGRICAVEENGILYKYDEMGRVNEIKDQYGVVTKYTYKDQTSDNLDEIAIETDTRISVYGSDHILKRVVDKETGKEYRYYYDGDIVTVKTIFTSKQLSVNDFSSCDKENVAVTDYEGITNIKLARDIPLDYGTGEDGVLEVKKGENIVLEARTYNFESIYVEDGGVLTITPWNGQTGGSMVINCQRDIVIDGTIHVNEAGYSTGQGPGAGGEGQQGYDVDNQNTVVRGSGGGGAGYTYQGTTGEYWGNSPGTPGPVYSDATLTEPQMGSGGGDGGIYNASNKVDAGVGGAGGGIIILTAPIVNINGICSANGGNGGNAGGGVAGSGGGGSGGSIVINGEQISIPGLVKADGGFGGVVGQNGGNGSAGRIRVNYGLMEGVIYAETVESERQAASVYKNHLTYLDSGSITSDAIRVDLAEFSDVDAHINANMDIPIQSNVQLFTSTCDTVNGTWSEWVEAESDQYGFKINSDIKQYIKYKIVLSTNDAEESPGVYGLDDFAVKMTFSRTEYLNESEVVFEADKICTDIPCPDINVDPLLFIDNIKCGEENYSGEVTSLFEADKTVSSSQISWINNLIMDNELDGDECIATKFVIDSEGGMTTEFVQSKSGSIEHYDSDGKVRFVTDAKTGAIIIRYYYDDATGELMDVRMIAEREVLSHQISEAQNEITRKRVEDLSRLAEQLNAAYSDLNAQVESIQAEFDSARAEIESLRYISYESQAQSAFGSKKITVTIENPYYWDMVDKLDLAEKQFHDNAAESYFTLGNMEEVSRGRIMATEMAALSNLNRQKEVCLNQILRKELTTIIYDNYLKFLGRLPSTNELNSLIKDYAEKTTVEGDTTYTLKLSALKADLESRQDRQKRLDEIEGILTAVFSKLDAYVTTPETKAALLSELSLENEDVIDLSAEDWDDIKQWLLDHSMHFGQSAFLVLKEVVDKYYDNNPDAEHAGEEEFDRYVRLASNAIMIDILVGAITKFTDDDLQISMYALSKAAEVEGCELIAYKLEWEDLKDQVAAYLADNARGQVIAHTNSDHYVLVTEIDAEGNVTYFEPNMGESGESITVTKEEFLNIWEGFALTNKAPPDGFSKRLTALQAQQIKGAGIFLIISIICSIISFGLSFIDNKICQILSKVFAIAALVCVGLEILGSLKSIFDTFVKGIDFFKDIFTKGFSEIGKVLSETIKADLAKSLLPSLGKAIGRTLISIPVSITMTKGLEVIGLDKTFARIAGSFLSGGLTSFTPAFDFGIGGAMQGLIISGVNALGDVFHVPSEISSVIGISVSALVGAGIAGYNAGGSAGALEAIKLVIGKAIMPNLVSELAFYGVTQLGRMLGVDPMISQVIGLGIRTSVSAGIGGNFDAKSMFDGAMNGLLQGTVSVALDWGGQELGLSPLLSSLTFNTISGAIEGLFGIPQYDPITNTYNRPNNIFEGIFNNYTNYVLSAVGVGIGDNVWANAVYRSQILDFADIVESEGIVNALESYGTGIFHQAAVTSMINIAGSVKNYFTDKIINKQYQDTFDEYGNAARFYDIDNFGFIETFFDEFGNEYLSGVSIGGVTQKGKFGVDSYGRFGLLTGELYYDAYYQYIQEGNILYMASTGDSGRRVAFIPSDDIAVDMANYDGLMVDGTYVDYDFGVQFEIKNNKIVNYSPTTALSNVIDSSTSLVDGLISVYDDWQTFTQGVNDGALATFLSRDYIDLYDTNSTWHGMPAAAYLANVIDSGLENFLTSNCNATTETLSKYLSFLGNTGTVLTDLYSDWVKLNNTLVLATVGMGTDLLRFGGEIPLMLDEIGYAYQAFEAGNLRLAGALVGGVLVRGYREGSRALLLGNIAKTSLKTVERFFLERSAGRLATGELAAYEFSHQNPGPLSDLTNYTRENMPAKNFFGGRYKKIILEDDVYIYRAAEISEASPGGWFTWDAPLSSTEVRIDSAVKRYWVDSVTGKVRVVAGSTPDQSVINAVFKYKIPKGTVIFEGPTGYQGCVNLGGYDKIQIYIDKVERLKLIPEGIPWTID